MPANAGGTAEQAASYAAQALVTIGAVAGDATALAQALALLGWDVPPGVDLAGAMTIDTSAVAQQLATVLGSTPGDLADEALMAERYAALLAAVGALVAQIAAFASALPGQLTAAGDYAAQTQIATELPRRLLDLLTVAALARSQAALTLLVLLGVVQLVEYPADPAIYQVPHVRNVVQWNRIGQLLSDPRQVFADQYGWGTASFDAEQLLTNLGLFVQALSGRPVIRDLPQSVEETLAGAPVPQAATDPSPQLLVSLVRETGAISVEADLSIHRLRPTTTGGIDAGLEFVPYVRGSVTEELPLVGGWTLGVDAALDLEGGVGISVRPGTVSLQAGLLTGSPTSASGRVGLVLIMRPAPSQSFGLLSVPGGSGLQVSEVSLEGGADVNAAGKLDPFVELKLAGGQLLVTTSQADSFLQQVLPASLSSTFDLTVHWSQLEGLHFSGGAQLAINIPLALNLGPITLTDLDIAITPSANDVLLTAGISGGLQVGPVTAVVQGVGVTGGLAFSSGNLGPVNLSTGFKPPDGLGLSLDAAPVSGAGFVAYDAANARYLGALALAIGDISVSAVGVLDTAAPGGGPGYSLVIVASADFPPAELGFGFSLVGIGGLVGVNRTTNVPVLQALARAGQLDSLMFPADLAHRAPQVAASLEQVFPAAQGHFIVGPAVRIEWGTGGMVDAEVGVFIELSDSGGGISLLRVALLGWVHLTLPDVLTPVADLTLDVLGVADLTAKTLSLDAGLRNSTIASFPLTGQAALRASWGASPSFVFAIGGFNPHFAVPAGFPALQRIALSIGGSDPRLRFSAYLALTSNTVQFGCAADLYASAGPVAVAASLSFDALLQFQPFGLIVDLTINATVLLGGSPVLSLSLDLHVTGPTPWAVTGSASFQVLCCSFTVPISITAGPQPPPQPPQTVDLDDNLTTALADSRSWQTGPPAGHGVVTVRGQNAASSAVHPLGTLTVRQHAVPLELHIERYGPDLLDAACSYQITAATIGGLAAQAADVTDFFAPAQFQTMTDAQKLSAPSFEPMTAGTTLGSAGLSLPQTAGAAGSPATVVDTASTRQFDVLMLDSPDPGTATGSTAGPVTASPGTATLPSTVLAAQLPAAAAAVNGAAGRGPELYAAPGCGIAVEQPTYAIVGMNLAALGSGRPISMGLPSVVAAVGAQAGQPGQAGQAGQPGPTGQDWQVVYTSEVPG
jgi:hypothetical protein